MRPSVKHSPTTQDTHTHKTQYEKGYGMSIRLAMVCSDGLGWAGLGWAGLGLSS